MVNSHLLLSCHAASCCETQFLLMVHAKLIPQLCVDQPEA